MYASACFHGLVSACHKYSHHVVTTEFLLRNRSSSQSPLLLNYQLLLMCALRICLQAAGKFGKNAESTGLLKVLLIRERF